MFMFHFHLHTHTNTHLFIYISTTPNTTYNNKTALGQFTPATKWGRLHYKFGGHFHWLPFSSDKLNNIYFNILIMVFMKINNCG